MAALIRAIALLAVAALAGCGFRGPLPADPPPELFVEIAATGVEALPWDGTIEFSPAGISYEVTFRAPPGTRRGSEPFGDAERRIAWDALVAAGFFDREAVLKGEATGPAVVEARAAGRVGRWSGDPAGDEPLRALLEALRPAIPSRAFRPLPGGEPSR